MTWATVAAAVASALWLAAVEPDPGATLRLTSLPGGLPQWLGPGDSNQGTAAAQRRGNGDAAAARAQPRH